jgi:hypothetical protein
MSEKLISTMTVGDLESLITAIVRREMKTTLPFIEARHNAKETAKILECSAPTLRSWGKRGLIQATKIGGKNYYTSSSIKAFIEKKIVAAPNLQPLN